MFKRGMVYIIIEILAIILCISTITFGAGPDKNKIVIVLKPANMVLKGSNNVAEFKENTFGNPGEPGLPVRSLTILLPPDADLKSVKVNIEQTKYDEVEGTWDVLPAPPVATVDGNTPIWPKGKEIVNGRDVQAYNINEFRPVSVLGWVNVGQLREYRLVDISINLYQYNPITKKIRRLTNGNLVVTFNRIAGIKLKDRSQKAKDFLEKIAVNFKDVAPEYTAAQDAKNSK